MVHFICAQKSEISEFSVNVRVTPPTLTSKSKIASNLTVKWNTFNLCLIKSVVDIRHVCCYSVARINYHVVV